MMAQHHLTPPVYQVYMPPALGGTEASVDGTCPFHLGIRRATEYRAWVDADRYLRLQELLVL